MAEIKDFFARFKLVRQRSSNLSKIVVIVTIVLCMGALGTLRLAMNKIENQTEDLRAQAAALEQENSDLEEKIQNLGSVQSVLEIAQEELGLVSSDTVVFQPES
ncbi:MAG: septum formation initiator family protein [Oscillospiraceae bacterium]|nr:septum formation initiator family protein [Oscillospiraceae bacterium]